jgi:hypothetical protein
VASWESLLWKCHCDALVTVDTMRTIEPAAEIPSMVYSIAQERSQMK